MTIEAASLQGGPGEQRGSAFRFLSCSSTSLPIASFSLLLSSFSLHTSIRRVVVGGEEDMGENHPVAPTNNLKQYY